MAKKILRKIENIIFFALALIFKLIPRNKHMWVTGKISAWGYDNEPPMFFDNSKYFFLYLVNNTNEKVYWISSSNKEIDLLQEMNLPVIRFPSLKGIFIVLRAKFAFHHYGINQINYVLQSGSVQINFWHGTPIKTLAFDAVGRPKQGFLYKIKKAVLSNVEFISSTSKYLSQNFLAKGFSDSQDKPLPESMFLNLGYPRTDILNLSKEDSLRFCKKYSRELLPYIYMAKKYRKVLLYMPTWREYDSAYFEKANLDLNKLSKALKSVDGILFLKLHPLTKYIKVSQFDNIVQITNDVDIYPFLIYTDYLITDYSSIFFDYLLLNKEIIFIPYDFDIYVQNRALYYDRAGYDEITPGVKYSNMGEFIDNIGNLDKLNYSKERAKVSGLMIENYNFDACERTYMFIKDKYNL